jgi:competence protein ComEC
VLSRAFAYAPLAPFAVAVTVALVADRHVGVPLSAWFMVAATGAAVALFTFRGRTAAAFVGLGIVAGGLAGAHHHSWRNVFPDDDVGYLAGAEPKLVRVRGALAEEPSVRRRPRLDPLVSRPRGEVSRSVLAVTEVQMAGNWVPASGRARLTVEGAMSGLHVGDEVEVSGWLSEPGGPMNPGEADFASILRDQRIRADLRVADSADGVVRLNSGPWGLDRVLAGARGWGQRGLTERLPRTEGPVAAALLLGDTTAMSADEWDRYVRTGVVHVLAISGQHLVILGAFLWFTLRLAGVRSRPAAVIVATTLLAYALMTGGRPSAIRAAVMAGAMCGAVLLRARALPLNTFALAWLIVLAINPTDLFTAGFQLSFLCVAVLVWGIPRWFPDRQLDPHDRLLAESRSATEQFLRGAVWWVGRLYLITLVLSIATAPLIAYWQNLVTPAGVLIGPLAILLTTFALVAGFMLLFLWPLGPVAAPFAWIAEQMLALCDALVAGAERLPGGYWYTGTLPVWWVVGFYAIGTAWLLAGSSDGVRLLPDVRRRLLFPTLLGGWVIVGLVAGSFRPTEDELRVTFLAVDHGACVVVEAPDGRVLLYDAGANSGPDVTRRHIAPYLWSRGIRRIDEVFLSHADLDHFNGLPALLDRFAVGQVTHNSTFAEKRSGGVKVALEAIERRGIRVRSGVAGDRFAAGDVTLDVLHPPVIGPVGVENVRSLVLLLRHRGHAILLTGDLEGPGVDHVIAQPAQPVDVLMVPHHGSGGARVAVLADWANARLAVSSQGRADAGKARDAFRPRGIPYWSTWPDGAITVRSHATGLTAESFATGQRMVVRPGGE